MPDGSPTLTPVLRLTLIVEGTLLALALGIGELTGHSLRGVLHLERAGSALILGVVATLPLLACLWWTLKSRLRALVGLRRTVLELIIPLFEGATSLHLALISLAAGVAEEALFRGLLLPVVQEWTSAITALVLTSLLFGAAHLVTRTYGLLAALIGGYLGALFLVSGSLLTPIVVHTLYDYIALEMLLAEHLARARASSDP